MSHSVSTIRLRPTVEFAGVEKIEPNALRPMIVGRLADGLRAHISHSVCKDCKEKARAGMMRPRTVLLGDRGGLGCTGNKTLRPPFDDDCARAFRHARAQGRIVIQARQALCN